jgi:hypothetical protein
MPDASAFETSHVLIEMDAFFIVVCANAPQDGIVFGDPVLPDLLFRNIVWLLQNWKLPSLRVMDEVQLAGTENSRLPDVVA